MIAARALALALLLAAAPIAAEEIRKWRTPDGGLYFGADPPAGSTIVGSVEATVTTGGDAAAAENRDAEAEWQKAVEEGKEVRRKRAERREADQGRREMLTDAVETVTLVVNRGNFTWLFSGAVRNRATETVHGVRVSAGGVSAPTSPAELGPGEQGTFSLQVEFQGGVVLPDSDAPPPLEVTWAEK